MTGGLNIFIFEDNLRLASEWHDYLQDRGHLIAHASTLKEAHLFLKYNTFDIAVLDVFIRDETNTPLPEGGVSLMSFIKLEIPKYNRPRCIGITGASPSMVKKFDPLRAMGADLNLYKPISAEELCVAIENLAAK